MKGMEGEYQLDGLIKTQFNEGRFYCFISFFTLIFKVAFVRWWGLLLYLHLE